MNTIEIKFESYGKKYEGKFRKTKYLKGNNLYVGVLHYDKEFKEYMPYCDVTVNLPEMELEPNYAFLDTNNCPKVIIEWLYNNGYIVDTGLMMPSGFCVYPLVEFTEEFLNGIETVE